MSFGFCLTLEFLLVFFFFNKIYIRRFYFLFFYFYISVRLWQIHTCVVSIHHYMHHVKFYPRALTHTHTLKNKLKKKKIKTKKQCFNPYVSSFYFFTFERGRLHKKAKIYQEIIFSLSNQKSHHYFQKTNQCFFAKLWIPFWHLFRFVY